MSGMMWMITMLSIRGQRGKSNRPSRKEKKMRNDGLKIGMRVIECNGSEDESNPPAQGTVEAIRDDGTVTVDWGWTLSDVDADDIMPVGGW